MRERPFDFRIFYGGIIREKFVLVFLRARIFLAVPNLARKVK
jgi:hypothetical protein